MASFTAITLDSYVALLLGTFEDPVTMDDSPPTVEICSAPTLATWYSFNTTAFDDVPLREVKSVGQTWPRGDA